MHQICMGLHMFTKSLPEFILPGFKDLRLTAGHRPRKRNNGDRRMRGVWLWLCDC